MTQATEPTARAVEQFLYREARLLDDGRFEEWLTLFSPDGVYWMPLAGTSDPMREPSVLYDTAADRAQRVHQLLHTPHYAQIPASRTHHQVSNVEVHLHDDGSATAYAVLVVHEVRPGDPGQVGLGKTRAISGRARYTLAPDRERGWLIREKYVELLGHDLPYWNLSFIF